MSLILIWVIYALVGIVIFMALFLWAVRTGQFREQDRARRLPLEHPPEEGLEEPPQAPKGS